jgi:hypothetical protein
MKYVTLAGLAMVALAFGDYFIGVVDESEQLIIFGFFLLVIGAVGVLVEVLVAWRSDAGRE